MTESCFGFKQLLELMPQWPNQVNVTMIRSPPVGGVRPAADVDMPLSLW